MTYHHTLVWPAFCSLCMQSEGLLPGERLQHWERDVDAIRHIEERHSWCWICNVCDFICNDSTKGCQHLVDAHGYTISNQTRVAFSQTSDELQLLDDLDTSSSNKSILASPSSGLISEGFCKIKQTEPSRHVRLKLTSCSTKRSSCADQNDIKHHSNQTRHKHPKIVLRIR